MTHTPELQHTEVHGMLAAQSGQRLPVQVLRSAAGFYLGTFTDDGPYSRESQEYWTTAAQAEKALVNGTWTQKPCL